MLFEWGREIEFVETDSWTLFNRLSKTDLTNLCLAKAENCGQKPGQRVTATQ